MTDPQQAARLAAIRARRGQAPLTPTEVPAATALPQATTPAATAANWGPPSVAPAPVVAVARAAATTPAPTGRTGRADRRRRHTAAASRIVATGLATSSVFVLIGVMGAAAKPSTPAADTPTPTDPTLAPAPTTAPVQTVVLTLPPDQTVAPAPIPVTAPGAPAPAPAAPAPKPAAPAPKPAAPKPAAKPAPAPAPAPAATTKTSGG